MQRAALFIDGANWSKGLLGRRINFDLLIRKIEWAASVKVVYQAYYATYRTQQHLEARMPFAEVLKRRRWQVFLMPAKYDASGGRYVDKEVDVAIALEAYMYAISGKADVIVVGSGDEDYCALYRRLPDGVRPVCLALSDAIGSEVRQLARVIELDKIGVFRTEASHVGPAPDRVPSKEGAVVPALQVDPRGSPGGGEAADEPPEERQPREPDLPGEGEARAPAAREGRHDG